jgi:hypothetical protein
MTNEMNTNERAKAYTVKGVVSDLIFRPGKNGLFATLKVTSADGETRSVAAFAKKAVEHLQSIQNGAQVALLAVFERTTYEVDGVKKTGRNIRAIWAGAPLPPKSAQAAA